MVRSVVTNRETVEAALARLRREKYTEDDFKALKWVWDGFRVRSRLHRLTVASGLRCILSCPVFGCLHLAGEKCGMGSGFAEQAKHARTVDGGLRCILPCPVFWVFSAGWDPVTTSAREACLSGKGPFIRSIGRTGALC